MKSAILGLALVLALSATVPQRLDAEVATGEIHGRVLALNDNKPLAYSNVIVVGTQMGAMSLADGTFRITGVPVGTYTLRAVMMGYKNVEQKNIRVKAGKRTEVVFKMEVTIVAQTQAIEVRGERPMVQSNPSRIRASAGDMHVRGGRSRDVRVQSDGVDQMQAGGLKTGVVSETPGDAWRYRPPVDREQYEHTQDNDFRDVMENPLSTFSIDVDRASYANARRFIRSRRLPPPAAVRIEEFVNYFDYDHPQPEGDEPFAVVTEVAGCPWNTEHRLVHIGLQGRRIEQKHLPPSNIVFLIDVSGSMQPENKLPMLRQALPMLVSQLRRNDRVAIVVYAGSAGLVLDATAGDRKRTILDAINRLQAGGSTAGGQGIALAYEVARRNFIKGGNNRVVLATDGDFNVGMTSDGELVSLIERERESGVFLTVLGVGEGNLQDTKMEKLADHGNGNYAYLDDLAEARKVLVNEMSGTLVTIAKDVKVQVEFNPARVREYRLIGYENRLLNREDFDDDRKDAGEIGAGHAVTALYEIVPVDGSERHDELRYSRFATKADAADQPELMTVALRYKAPDGDTSKLLERRATDTGLAFDDASENFRFAAAVAEFGMLLRDSPHRGNASFAHVITSASAALGDDPEGYRSEFIGLAADCRALKPEVATER